MTKNKKALVLIVIFISSWVDLSAQHFEDVVYLKNGSIIHGKVLWQTEDSFKIETNWKDHILLSKNELLEIKQEKPQRNLRSKYLPKENGGFYSYTTLGLLAGDSEVVDATYSFQTNFGYEFNYLIGAGLGVGIENLKTEILPVFVSFRSNLFNTANSPTVNLSIGYSFPLNTTKKEEYRELTYEGGLNIGCDIGICSFSTNKKAFTITAGYHYQVIKEQSMDIYYLHNQSTIETTTYEFNKISVKIGFLFR